MIKFQREPQIDGKAAESTANAATNDDAIPKSESGSLSHPQEMQSKK
jgi:hypothetical protein